jgi:hypothetical protein
MGRKYDFIPLVDTKKDETELKPAAEEPENEEKSD